MSNSSLVDIRVPAHSGNYGGARKKIDLIVVHHMASILTAQQCGNIFARKGRGGSAHYGIGSDGKIGLYVDEGAVAWHAGNWPVNQRSVGIETSNSKTGGDWPVSDQSLKLLIKLVADIAKRNGLGTLVVGKNLGYHSMYAATACPGNYLRSKMEYIATEANKINKGGSTPKPAPKPAPAPAKDKFLPAKGYWARGDKDARINTLSKFMYKTFPSYTKKAALGPIYGPNLIAAIKEFQRRTGLVPDGMTGPLTLAKLRQFGFKG